MKRWVESEDRRSASPISVNAADEKLLTRLIAMEISIAMGFAPGGILHHFFAPIFQIPATRFSRIAVQFDQIVANQCFPAACRWVLPFFISGEEIYGSGSLPQEGPLLLIANHPGIVDGLLLVSSLQRNDVKVIASGVPFLRGMPNSANHMIYSSHDPGNRVRVLRESVRHLRSSGALLIMPGGNVEPDPAVLPGGVESLNYWSQSVGMLVRSVRNLRVYIALIGGILARRSLQTPLAVFGNSQLEKQKIAEYVQVMKQMVFPKSVAVAPRVIYQELSLINCTRMDAGDISSYIIQQTARLMKETFYFNGSHSIPCRPCRLARRGEDSD